MPEMVQFVEDLVKYTLGWKCCCQAPLYIFGDKVPVSREIEHSEFKDSVRMTGRPLVNF